MARHTASWWAKRVEELARGDDAAEVARRHGVKARTLVWWRSELARRGRKRRKSAPRLLPVVVDASLCAVPGGHDDTVEVVVEVGAARVVARGAITPAHLAAIVAAARPC